jgi:hypothetical protein
MSANEMHDVIIIDSFGCYGILGERFGVVLGLVGFLGVD